MARMNWLAMSAMASGAVCHCFAIDAQVVYWAPGMEPIDDRPPRPVRLAHSHGTIGVHGTVEMHGTIEVHGTTEVLALLKCMAL